MRFYQYHRSDDRIQYIHIQTLIQTDSSIIYSPSPKGGGPKNVTTCFYKFYGTLLLLFSFSSHGPGLKSILVLKRCSPLLRKSFSWSESDMVIWPQPRKCRDITPLFNGAIERQISAATINGSVCLRREASVVTGEPRPSLNYPWNCSLSAREFQKKAGSRGVLAIDGNSRSLNVRSTLSQSETRS